LTSKTCSKCEREQSLFEFHKNKLTKTGYSYQCKTCIKLKNHNRYLSIREEYLAKTAAYYRKRTEEHRKQAPADIVSKYCGMCKCSKITNAFNKNRTSKDGYETYCKDCKNEYRRRKYKEDPERFRETGRRHYRKFATVITERNKSNEKRSKWQNQLNAYNVLFMSDPYLKKTILQGSIDRIPKELLEAKQKLISLQRSLKEIK
jgi:hypothetical protein